MACLGQFLESPPAAAGNSCDPASAVENMNRWKSDLVKARTNLLEMDNCSAHPRWEVIVELVEKKAAYARS